MERGRERIVADGLADKRTDNRERKIRGDATQEEEEGIEEKKRSGTRKGIKNLTGGEEKGKGRTREKLI